MSDEKLECSLCDEIAVWKNCRFVVDSSFCYGTEVVVYDLCDQCLNEIREDESYSKLTEPEKALGVNHEQPN